MFDWLARLALGLRSSVGSPPLRARFRPIWRRWPTPSASLRRRPRSRDGATPFSTSLLTMRLRLRRRWSRRRTGCGSSRRRRSRERELVWEPRLGDVAASGDLGWLTGPSTSINNTTKDASPATAATCRSGESNRMAGGGCSSTSAQARPNRFRSRPASRVSRSVGGTRARKARRRRGRASPRRTAISTRRLAQGAARAFAGRLTPASRLHRPGFVAVVGTEAIAAWLTEHASTATAKDGAAEAAAAGDFGYTYGTFEIRRRRRSQAPTSASGTATGLAAGG